LIYHFFNYIDQQQDITQNAVSAARAVCIDQQQDITQNAVSATARAVCIDAKCCL
jgi:hypothetical protein